jgi:hypothetical protein
MRKRINLIKQESGEKLNLLESMFIFFCLMPFIFPNPFVATNIQPYAALLGALILLMRLYQMRFILRGRPNTFIVISFATFLVALLVLFVFPITTNAFRALYNYFAVAVIPLATLLVLQRIKCFPEHMVKVLILRK